MESEVDGDMKGLTPAQAGVKAEDEKGGVIEVDGVRSSLGYGCDERLLMIGILNRQYWGRGTRWGET